MDEKVYVYEKGIGKYDKKPFLYRYTFNENHDLNDIFDFIDAATKNPIGTETTYQITTTYKEEYWGWKTK